jgi:hypothetical protein
VIKGHVSELSPGRKPGPIFRPVPMKRNSQKEGRSCETASGVVCFAVIIMASSRLIGARSKAARKRWRFFFNKQESRISPERCRVYAHKRGVVRKWAGIYLPRST